MTRSNFDLRTWTRISVLAGVAVMLGVLVVGPWLWLLIGFAIAMSRRGQRLLFGTRYARPSHSEHRGPWTPVAVDDRSQPSRRRPESPAVRMPGGPRRNRL